MLNKIDQNDILGYLDSSSEISSQLDGDNWWMSKLSQAINSNDNRGSLANSRQSIISEQLGYLVSTGINPIYEIVDGEQIPTKEFMDRYINEKVEKELVDFKTEIEEKFIRSDINSTYVFKRTRKKIRVSKSPEDLESRQIEPSYTFNEKILMKNMNKYEKAILGLQNPSNKNEYSDNQHTFDYKLGEEQLIKKQTDSFYREDYDKSSYHLHQESGKSVGTQI